MNRPGHQLLAGAGFPFDQHRGGGGGHVLNELEDFLHGRVFAQNILEGKLLAELLAQVRHLILQGALAQSPLDDQPQVVDVDGFGQEIISSQPHGLDCLVNAAKTGHDNHGYGQLPPPDLLDQLHAVELRHLQVGEKDAVVVFGQSLQGSPTIAGGIDLEAFAGLQKSAQLVACLG